MKSAQVAKPAAAREMMAEMNAALVIGSVRQHELIEASEKLNAQLRQEMRARALAEEALQKSRQEIKDHADNLEKVVAARTAELTAKNQQLEAFVYSIAHDLRAPLRAMQGFSEMLVEEAGPALNEKAQDYASRIDKAAQFMDALLLDLLAFSRINQQSVVLTPVDLKSAIEPVISRLQEEIKDKKARVENSGPWPTVLAHESTLVQVLFNLVNNALKFVTPDVLPVVRIRTEERPGFVRIWVEDNGPGIAPEYQAEIFRLFTRLDGKKHPGTGVGLAIVQKGVERMGGKVGVESAPGQGSRFWFDLQRAS